MLTKKQYHAALRENEKQFDRLDQQYQLLDKERTRLESMRGITKKQFANLQRALALMESISPRHIDLDIIRWDTKKQKKDVDDDKLKKGCGTVACVGGWCSADPYFKAQGLSYSVEEEYLAFRSRRGGTTGNLSIMSQELFGWLGIFDGSETDMHPKKEAVKRLQDAINKSYII